MILKSIHIQNFRSYEDKEFDFNPQLTIIVGPNAHGKTNLLESIYFTLTGKGLKDIRQEELIQYDKDTADVEIKAEHDDVDYEYRVHIQKGVRLTKTYFLNKAKKILYAYVKQAPPVVVFTPDMISVINGSPSQRRTFFDTILSTIDITYKKTLNQYETTVRKRNRILQQDTPQHALKDYLQFWNDTLIDQAAYIQEKRQWLAKELNRHPQVNNHLFHLTYVEHEISKERFDEYFMKEFYQKRTLIGPHRDEYHIDIIKGEEQINTRMMASRGEQRLALFWIILQQLSLYKSFKDFPPILLLDDIFSELDESNKKLIFEVIHEHQTLITTTDRELVSHPEIHAEFIRL